MFEDILNEIKSSEEKARQQIEAAKEEQSEKIRQLKDDFEKDISSLREYEKTLSEKLFAEESKKGEEEAGSISGEYMDQIQNIRFSAEKKMDEALESVLKGMN